MRTLTSCGSFIYFWEQLQSFDARGFLSGTDNRMVLPKLRVLAEQIEKEL